MYAARTKTYLKEKEKKERRKGGGVVRLGEERESKREEGESEVER